jgi:multidrug transporter EmrE-like cation transporter
MKWSNIFTHPITQVFSFCIILISGSYFGGPYIFFLYHAAQEGIAFAIIGLLGITLCLASLIIYKSALQLAGTLMMVLSLVIFFWSPRWHNSSGTFSEPLPLVTILLFIIISVLTISRIVNAQTKKLVI